MKVEPFKLERYFAKYEFTAAYMLSSSDCEPLTLKELLALADKESLKLWDDLWLGYTESQGNPILREEVAKFYKHVRPENVIEVVPEEGIYMSMQVLLEKGDHVICTFPGYQTLYDVASSIGCDVTKIELDQEKGWFFDIELVLGPPPPDMFDQVVPVPICTGDDVSVVLFRPSCPPAF